MLARAIASFTLSLSALATGSVLDAPPAHADTVAQAQLRVQQLQGRLAGVTVQLERGTRQWEQEQAALRQLQARLTALDARVRHEQDVADAGRERLGVLARRMYMNPMVNELPVAVGLGTGEVNDVLRTKETLTRVGQGDAQVVREADVSRLALTRDRQQVADLGSRARVVSQQAAAQLAALERLATSTSTALLQAQAALSDARAQEALRLARLSEVSAVMDPTGGAALCLSSDTSGMANGNLDASVLCPLWMAPGQRMRTDAAKAFDKLSAFHARTTGTPLCVSDSYRSYAQQVDVYQRKPGLAAVPGTSNHGWGQAVDLGCGVESFKNPAYAWMKQYGPRFGFHHPAWAEPQGGKPEPWHWEFGTTS